MSEYGQDFAMAMLPPAPGAILEVRLRPYCLGHELLLQRHGSPFAAPENEEEAGQPGAGDLLFALAVCSRDYEAAVRWTRGKEMTRWLAMEGKKLEKFPDLYVQHRVILFREYAAEAWKHPFFSTPNRNGSKTGAPLVASIFLTMRRVYGKSELEAFNTPLRQGLWEHLAFLEAEGLIEIRRPMTKLELAAVQEKAKEAAELLKKLRRN